MKISFDFFLLWDEKVSKGVIHPIQPIFSGLSQIPVTLLKTISYFFQETFYRARIKKKKGIEPFFLFEKVNCRLDNFFYRKRLPLGITWWVQWILQSLFVHFPQTNSAVDIFSHWKFFKLPGIKPGATGSGGKYANHCAILPFYLLRVLKYC